MEGKFRWTEFPRRTEKQNRKTWNVVKLSPSARGGGKEGREDNVASR